MAHLSDWHVFNPSDRKTYPKVNAPVQVRFDSGQTEEGDSLKFFPQESCFPVHRQSTLGGTSSKMSDNRYRPPYTFSTRIGEACAKQFRTFAELAEKLNMDVTDLMRQCTAGSRRPRYW